MYILSGKVRAGDVGEETSLLDAGGNPLFVGDIVSVVQVDEMGNHCFSGLSAIVSDKWLSYTDKESNRTPHFVMGLKCVDINTSTEWIVYLAKSHKDVMVGEHWKEYGFSYHLDFEPK